MPAIPKPRRFWILVAATLLAGVALRAVILNSRGGTPWGSSAGLLGIPPDWRVWLAIATVVTLVGPFLQPQLVVSSASGVHDEPTVAGSVGRLLNLSVVGYLSRLRKAIAGAVAGIVVWDFPVLCLYASGLIRVPGTTLFFTWALIIGAGLGTVCGVASVPWIAAVVGALALARMFLSRAAPSEVPWVLVALAAGAMLGYLASWSSLALRRRMILLQW